MHTLANSEDTNEMPHYAAFRQGKNCLLRQKPAGGVDHTLVPGEFRDPSTFWSKGLGV